MTAKRFKLGIDDKNGVGLFNGDERLLYIRFSNFEDAVSCKDALKHHCNLMNELHEENQELRLQLNLCSDQRNEFHRGVIENANRVGKLLKENEQLKSDNINQENIITVLRSEIADLKQTMKEVAELLSEEVDLFSDKATEHDICAYVELKELDNKDAFYMATSTKKAIKMLKELEE